MTIARIIALAPVVYLLGCAGAGLQKLDREVADLLSRRHEATLGVRATRDPMPVPEPALNTEPGSQAYLSVIPTLNPEPNELPVTKDVRGHEMAVTAGLPMMLDPGDEAIPFDLEKSLAHAIAHGREYRNEKDRLFQVALDVMVERHLFSPRLFSRTAIELSGTPEGGDHEHALAMVEEAGVTQKLPYGSELAATSLLTLVNRLRSTSGSGDPNTQSTDLTLSATIPLLRGAGQIAREDLIQAERELLYATRRFERSRRQFLVQISTDYYDLLRQQAEIENTSSQYRNLQDLADRFKALAEAGRRARFEYEEAQQRALSARNRLLNTQERYATLLDAFKLRLGLTTTQPLRVVASEVTVPLPLLNMKSAVQTALQYRLDYQTSSDRVEDARRVVANANNQMLPDLDIASSARLSTDDNNGRGGLNFDAGAGNYSTGFSFGAPLDQRIERIQQRSAVIDAERAHRDYTLRRDQIALDVRRSVRQIEQSRFALDLENRRVELADKQVLGVQLRSTVLDVDRLIEAEEDRTDALNRRDTAVRDLRVSILNYLLDTGQMRVSAEGRWLTPGRLVVPPKVR